MIKVRWLAPLLLIRGLVGQDQATPDQPPAAAPETPQTLPASVSEVPPQPGAQPPEREVSLNPKKFAGNFFSDQKRIWRFPAKVVTGKHLLPTLAVLGATAGIAAGLDPVSARYFRRHPGTFEGFNNALSEHRTTAATLLTPAAFFAAGLIKKDSYLAHTGLLAAEAWVDVDILGEVMRNVVRRQRPLDISPNGSFADYSHTWFKTHGSPLKTSGSFPSGHTAWGFAVATVVARRYPHHKWVRFVAYGLATVDLLSRVTSSNHFVSDAAFGAVLGYATGRFVVLRQ